MKKVLLGLVAAAACANAEAVKVDFSAATQRHHKNASKAVVGSAAEGDDFRVFRAGTNRCDTAWSMVSAPVPVAPGAKVAVLEFEIFSDVSHRRTECHHEWSSRLSWRDAAGSEVANFPFLTEFLPDAWRRYRMCAAVPAGAASVTLQLGVDNPDIRPGQCVKVRGAQLSFCANRDDLPEEIVPDTHYPMVTRRFESPTADANVVAKFEVTDPSGVDWDGVKAFVRGEKDAVPFAREGNVIALKHGPWKAGQNTLVIQVRDLAGNAGESRQAFFIGEKPPVPDVTLRADGATLIGGEPFFPIGVYAVNPRDFNAYNLDRGMADLKEAGFNLVHSYDNGTTPEMMATAARHGMKQWTIALAVADGSKWVADTGRYESSVIAWYLGDDTAVNTPPERLHDRNQSVRAVDGRRLTCQADAIMAENPKDRYQDYVRYTDVFMPEIYPVIGDDEHDRACVATTANDVRRFFADVKKYGDGSPKAIWPVIQNFCGYGGWKRYPTRDELYAMCFVSIVQGAKGLVFYTYGGYTNPEKGTFGAGGITATASAWAATTNVTRHVSFLSPVLLAEDVPQPPAPVVLEGPAKDAFGHGSVPMLLKRLNGETYVIAVNATKEPVKARISFGDASGEADVLWEGRKVAVANGKAEDAFNPFAVHVYKMK